MGAIVRELKSVSGAILGITILLIITFWVLNFISTRAPSPVSGIAGFAFNRASGQAYSAAPVMATSPYSANGQSYI